MLNQKGEGISIEDAEYIVEAGAEAYDNIFRCIDFYSGSIEIELFDTLIGLSENQFLYNLYYAYQYETEKEYINWIDCLFHDESSVEFLKLKEKIKILNDELPLYENKTINKTND